jgi:hydrogenase maturation protease
LDVLAGRRKVVVIDAIAGSSAPGTVLRLSPADLAPQHAPGFSLHEVGFFEALTMARQLGIAPQEVVILGVKPHDVSCGLDLSPETARLVPRIIELVRAEIEQQDER